MNNRPDIIATALETAEDVSPLLEDSPTAADGETAGKALIRAGIALLFQHRGPVVVMPMELSREVYCTLKNGAGALDLILENLSNIDESGGVSAVVDLTRTALATKSDEIDEVVLRRAGWVFNAEGANS